MPEQLYDMLQKAADCRNLAFVKYWEEKGPGTIKRHGVCSVGLNMFYWQCFEDDGWTVMANCPHIDLDDVEDWLISRLNEG